MRRVDVIDLLLLAAIWGSSFLFIRLSVGDFGPIALSGMRTLIAGVTLLPILGSEGPSKSLASEVISGAQLLAATLIVGYQW